MKIHEVLGVNKGKVVQKVILRALSVVCPPRDS